jgi:hypothetical protein
MDTNIIEDNTADSLRVVLTEETPVDPIDGEYTASDGTVIRGSGLTVVSSSNTTLTDLKNNLVRIQADLDSFDDRKRTLEEEKIRLTAEIDSISTEVNASIETALRNGATDHRTRLVEGTPIITIQ